MRPIWESAVDLNKRTVYWGWWYLWEALECGCRARCWLGWSWWVWGSSQIWILSAKLNYIMRSRFFCDSAQGLGWVHRHLPPHPINERLEFVCDLAFQLVVRLILALLDLAQVVGHLSAPVGVVVPDRAFASVVDLGFGEVIESVGLFDSVSAGWGLLRRRVLFAV